MVNPQLTADRQRVISQSLDINNSDIALCEYRGKTVVYASWGNQQGKEFLAEATYDGSLASFLRGFFP